MEIENNINLPTIFILQFLTGKAFRGFVRLRIIEQIQIVMVSFL